MSKAAAREGAAGSPRCPHDVFLETAPDGHIVWSDAVGWVVTRHADIDHILRQTQNFSSRASGNGPLLAIPGYAEIQAAAAHDTELALFVDMMEGGDRQTLLNADPPRHGDLRQALVRPLAPPAIAKMAERLQAAVDALLAALPDDGEIDFVAKVAIPLPLRVVGDFLGIPEAARQSFLEIAEAANFEELTPEAARLAVRGEREVRLYFAAQIQHAPKAGETFLSSLRTRVETGNLTLDEAAGLCREVVVAGNESTRFVLVSAIRLLLMKPDLLTAVRADPERLKPFIEEVLRLYPPFGGFWRRPLDAVTVGDVSLGKGDPVLLAYVAANRDPRAFPDPDTPALDRPNPERHLGFGLGKHACPGAHLARAELYLMLKGFIQAFDFQVTHPVADIFYNLDGSSNAIPMTLRVRRLAPSHR